MKCTVEKTSLLEHLQKVCNVVARKSALPIIGNIRISANEGMLNLTATDLEITISTEFKADIETSGVTTLPARSLLALVSKFKGDKVEINSGENHHAKLTCGSAEFMLKGLDPADFPEAFHFETKRKLRLEQTVLRRMIDSVAYAVASDDSRKVLQGILFSARDGVLTVVATDGKRLALFEKETQENSGDGDIVLPLKSALELKRLLGDEGTVGLEIDDRCIRIQIGDTVILSRLIEGTYPAVRQVIPESSSKELEIPVQAVLETLDLLSVPLTADAAEVALTFRKGELEFYSHNESVGEGKDRIEIGCDYGEPLEITFNYQFLLAPFKYVGGEMFRIKMSNAVSPVILEDGNGFTYVIMPMRKK